LSAGREPEIAWQTDYQSVAGAAQHLIATARRLGARVYERATPEHLRDATHSCGTVVLFAHWRGAKIDASDLLAEPHIIWLKLRQHPYFSNLHSKRLDDIVDALNGAVENMRLLDELPTSVAVAASHSRSIGQTLCRDLLDEYMGDPLAPGNRLEFFNGLCTPDEVDRTMWSGFDGELDLAICHSEALATFLDIRRGDRFRHLHWPTVLHPLPQLLKVAATLELVAAEGGSYIDKRLLLEEAETRS
jgi:hypothetical protein